jgi:hypothetical protein
LFELLRWRIKFFMRFRLYPCLPRLASFLMLLAMIAFVQQSGMIAASQALASAGSMSDPAVTLSGTVHYHNNLARHVHTHGSHNSVGHVHDTADIDHAPDEANAPLWSLGCTSAVIPVVGICTISFEVVRADDRPHVRLDGIEPDGMSRPPSTPSIG